MLQDLVHCQRARKQHKASKMKSLQGLHLARPALWYDSARLLGYADPGFIDLIMHVQ